MTAESESLILNILKNIQSDIADIKQDIRDLKLRVGVLEGHLSGLMVAQHHTNERLDRADERVARIERRLNLVDMR